LCYDGLGDDDPGIIASIVEGNEEEEEDDDDDDFDNSVNDSRIEMVVAANV
jgi:hypothetical protein